MSSRYFLGTMVAFFIAIVGAWCQVSGKADLVDNAQNLVPGLTATLIIVSTLLERAIEVLVGAPRDPEKRRLLGGDLKSKVEEFRDETRHRTTVFGIIVGSALSFSGIRTIGVILETEGLNSVQLGIFVGADILLTGFLLAGGSEAIHSFIKRIKEFLKPTPANFEGPSA